MLSTYSDIPNRVITDKAKSIVQILDEDDDGLARRDGLLKSDKIRDEKLGKDVFAALDMNGNGHHSKKDE